MRGGGRMSRLIRPLRQWTVRSRIVAALALLAAVGRLLDTGASGERPDPDLGSLAQLQQHADAGTPYTVEGSTSAWRVQVVRLPAGRATSPARCRCATCRTPRSACS